MATMVASKVNIDATRKMLFVDASYFVFYRYFATYNWFRLQDTAKNGNDELSNDLINNKTFVAKYEKVFEDTVKKLVKQYSVAWDNVVFFKDSPRMHVWRNDIFEEYKAARETSATFNADVFQYTFAHLLPKLAQKLGFKMLQCDRLEADDLIAIVKGVVRAKMPCIKITIITNDNDYVQLYDDHTSIVNLQGKELKDRVGLDGDSKAAAREYLLKKVIMGDKSDCIPSIKKKVGPKTADKLAKDPVALQALFDKHPEAKQQFDLNKTLIDMTCIPQDLEKAVLDLIEVTGV